MDCIIQTCVGDNNRPWVYISIAILNKTCFYWLTEYLGNCILLNYLLATARQWYYSGTIWLQWTQHTSGISKLYCDASSSLIRNTSLWLSQRQSRCITCIQLFYGLVQLFYGLRLQNSRPYCKNKFSAPESPASKYADGMSSGYDIAWLTTMVGDVMEICWRGMEVELTEWCRVSLDDHSKMYAFLLI